MNDKKTYKEKNGTTRVGDFLRSINRDDIAKKLFQSGKELITGDVLGALEVIFKKDDTFTPQTYKMALHMAEMDLKESQEVSKRWVSDSQSDSWLTRSARPLTLLYLVFLTSVVVILDSSNALAVALHWVELLKSTLAIVIVAFFGSRGYEKIKKNQQ